MQKKIQQQQHKKAKMEGHLVSRSQVLAFSPTSPELPGFSTMALNAHKQAHARTNSLRTVCVYKECKSIFKCLTEAAESQNRPSSVFCKPHSLGASLCLSSVAAASSTRFRFVTKGRFQVSGSNRIQFKINE